MENFKKSRDELKFQGRRKRGGDDVDGNRLKPYYHQPLYNEKRAQTKSAQQSSTRVNNSCAMSNSTSVCV